MVNPVNILKDKFVSVCKYANFMPYWNPEKKPRESKEKTIF